MDILYIFQFYFSSRFGSLSGIDPSTLFPSKDYILQEREAEKRWWPTLQQMIKEVAEKNKQEKLKQQQRFVFMFLV